MFRLKKWSNLKEELEEEKLAAVPKEKIINAPKEILEEVQPTELKIKGVELK
jgi:hypothetical protein